MLKYLKLFDQFLHLTEKKPAGAPSFHHSDAPDANGRFKDLSIKDLAAWLIKTRNKDVKKISGSLTQQIVFNRKSDPKYAEKMEKTRKEVYKQLGREDLLKEALLEKGYNMDDIHDLIAFHRFNKDFRKLSAKDKEWVENDAKERGFNESVNNEDYLKKVNFILAGKRIEGLTGKNNKRIYGKINDVCLDELFNSFYAQGDYKKDLDVNPKLPLIYYGGNSKEGLDFLKKYNVSEDVMYNLPEAMKVSGNKSDFYKMFKDADFIPKAVYKKEDAKDLQFPIIAKPDDGHSGLGIEIFDTYEDLEKSKGKFENYSEAKDLDREFRVLLMNDDPVLVHERVSLNENEIKDKEADEQTEFTYVDQDMSKLDFMDKVNDICKKVREKLKLGLWSIDLMIDKSGDCWVAEINSASGMAADKMARVYVKVYEDFYGEKLPQEFKTHLNEEYIKPIYKINLKENADQIKRSKCCVNYQDIIDGKETIL